MGPPDDSFCHMCHGWEPRRGAYRVCAECGHVYPTPRSVVTWEHAEADVLAQAGIEMATHDWGQGRDIVACPMCGTAW